MTVLIIAFVLILGLALFYLRRSYWAWVVPGALALAGWVWSGVGSPAHLRVADRET